MTEKFRGRVVARFSAWFPVSLWHGLPAFIVGGNFFIYSTSKAIYGMQGKLGLPGGPEVTGDNGHTNPALDQFVLAALGFAAALLAFATIHAAGRRIPRWLLMIALLAALVPMGAGGAAIVYDSTVGGGQIGWTVSDALTASLLLVLWCVMIWGYFQRTRRRPRTGGGAATDGTAADVTAVREAGE